MGVLEDQVLISTLPTFNDTNLIRSCDSAIWQGATYKSSGLYYDSLQTASGCDSVLVLDLTINNSYEAAIETVVACDSAILAGCNIQIKWVVLR